jgi:hypothetical protein
MTATPASKATHHQSYAVNAPSPAATPIAGATYNIRRVPPILEPTTPNSRPTNIAPAANSPMIAPIASVGSTTATKTATRM